MKKIIFKLFIATFAIFSNCDIFAQTSWATPEGGKTYYIYNVDAGRFLNRGNDWGAQGSALETGEAIRLEVVSTGVYRLRTNNGNQGMFWENDNVWMDGGGSTDGNRTYEWILTQLSDGFYTLTPQGKTNLLGMWADTPENTRVNTRFKLDRHDDAPIRWAFITADQYAAAQANAKNAITARASLRPYIISARNMGFTSEETNAFYNINSTAATLNAALNTLPAKLLDYALANGTEATPMDLSFLIKNAYCTSTTNWNASGGSWATNNWNFQENGNACGWGIYLERWVGSANTLSDTELSQNLTGLPVGGYILQVDACAARQDGTKPEITGTQVFAEAYQSTATNISTPNEVPNTWQTTFVTINGNAKVGFKQVSTNANWVMFDNFKLYFVGVTIDVLKISLDEALTLAENIDKSTLNSGLTALLEEAISDGVVAQSSDNKDEVQTATNNLNNTLASIDAVVARIPSANTEIERYESVYTNSEAKDKTIYRNAINTAKAAIDAATSVSAIESAIATLEIARQTYVTSGARPTEGHPFDMTFLVKNPYFDGTLSPWTGEGVYTLFGGNGFDGKTRFVEFCDWGAGSWNGAVSQTLNAIPNGTYIVKAAAQGSSTDVTITLTANENSANWTCIGDAGGNIAADGSVVASGSGVAGWQYVEVECKVTNGTLTIKGSASATAVNRWANFDHVTLSYKEGLDLSETIATLEGLLETANGISGKMNATVQANLTSAIENADVTSEDPNALDAMVLALQEAIPAAQTSIVDYTKLKKYIDMTAVFADVTVYQNKYDAGEYIADDVEPTRQELNVLRYNAASTIYTNNVEVTGWSGSMGDKGTKGQHWDGTSTTTYYDNNSWAGASHSTATSVTLPAGTYVLKAALRSAPSTTLTLTVLDQVVNVEGKGDQGYGIDINGTANFSLAGTYANGNNGRGWEWEFVKFELASETTVTLSVESNYNGVTGWASFSDITLWMDDETYVAVNGHAIDEPLMKAQALVNTLPMGDTENTALQAAIDLCNTKATNPDELNAQIEALNTAVANANTWRTAYNEAKAPLLKAFDRFEYGFNNGAEGRQVETMNDDAWTALLEAVKTAGADKDITNSYAHFANATTNFNTAMDVAMAQFSMAEQYNSTYYIANADCAVNDAWVGNGRTTATGQHWSGDSERVYFTQNVDGTARTQTISLPYNGWYLLRASVRAANEGTFSKVIVDGVEYTANGPHGTVGGTIATDGSEWDSVADGIAAGKTFANNNAGYGWVYKYIPIKITDATKDVTIGINLTKNASNIGGMDLFFTGKNCHFKEDDIVKHYGDYATGFATTHTTHDVTNATMSGLSLDVTNNPNTIILATEGQVTNEKNVVINGTCANFVLTDGYDFNAVQDFTATKTSYNRSFATDTWTTVIVPFDYELPDGVVAEELNFIAFNGPDNNWISFKEVTTTMTANTPYILKNNSATAALFANLGIKTVYSTASTNSVEVPGATMKGTYKAITAEELVEQEDGDIIFVNTAGEGKYIDDEDPANITFPAGRAYIVVNKNTFSTSAGVAPKFTIFHGDDDLNSIEETVNVEVKDDVIYDLAGRRIVKPTKAGIYIVNGKKMIIK